MPRYERKSFVRTSVKDTFGNSAPFAIGCCSACAVGGLPINMQQMRRTCKREKDLFIEFFKFPHEDFKGRSFIDIMDIDVPDYPFFVDNEKGAFGDAV